MWAEEDPVVAGHNAGINDLDAESEGRFRPSVMRRRRGRLLNRGLRVHCTLDASYGRVQVVLHPSHGWTGLCTQAYADAQPYGYHISLCYGNECSQEEVAAAIEDIDGWSVHLRILWISYRYVAVFEPSQFPDSVRRLHSRGWHHPLFCCSM